MYLLYLKNPPASFLIDSCDDTKLGKLEALTFTQDGFSIIVPSLITSNIAYIKQLSEEEEKLVREQMLQATGRIEPAKGAFKFPPRPAN